MIASMMVLVQTSNCFIYNIEINEQISGVYADIHVNSTSNKHMPYPMSDDRVQYAKLNHCETNESVTEAAKVYEPSIIKFGGSLSEPRIQEKHNSKFAAPI